MKKSLPQNVVEIRSPPLICNIHTPFCLVAGLPERSKYVVSSLKMLLSCSWRIYSTEICDAKKFACGHSYYFEKLDSYNESSYSLVYT